MHATLHLLEDTSFPPLRRATLDTLQLNLGYKCNQQCVHCHVNASPSRTESMTKETIDEIVSYLHRAQIRTLDITGGAPELNPHFRTLVLAARELGLHVIDRCNLTILQEPGQEDLGEFLAAQGVEIIASLPCYLEENVDAQRGKGVYTRSIQALQQLNRLGYGKSAQGLQLNLVYNPQGPNLPPPQHSLEQDYKNYLREHYDIAFNRLYTLANMPILRFGSMLVSKHQFEDYMSLLKSAHRDTNLDSVMCRKLISVDWQGYVYDCDFNQMLGLPLQYKGRSRLHIRDMSAIELSGNPIVVKNHCYACTAGQGSSCGGALQGES